MQYVGLLALRASAFALEALAKKKVIVLWHTYFSISIHIYYYIQNPLLTETAQTQHYQ